MGDASRVRVAIAEEVTFGTNPAAGFEYLRLNSESLKLDVGNVQSKQLDATRQPAPQIRTNLSASGDIACEDSLVTPAATPTGFDLLIEGALMTDFGTIANNAAVSLTIGTPSAGVFTIAGTGALTNVAVGDWVKITGMVQGTMYVHILTRASADAGTGEGVLAATGVAVVAGGPTSSTISGSSAHIGTTKKSYTIERQYTDLTVPEYSLYTGMRVGRWNLRLSAQAIFEHSFSFTGKLQATTTSTGAGTPTAVWATPILEAVDHYKQKMLDSFAAVSTARLDEVTFTLDNRLRTEPELGVLGSTDIGISTPTLEGSIKGYMQNADLVRLAEAGTRSKLAFRLDDGTRARIISIEQILFGSPDIGAKGNDQSVEFTLPFSAEANTAGIAMTVSRF